MEVEHLRPPPLPLHERKLDFPSKSSAAGAGLLNVGNTCYLNSVLQCVIHTVPMVEKLRSSADHHHPPGYGKDEFCSLCALRNLVLLSMAESATYLVPHDFTDNLGKISNDLLLARQEDAHEFLLFLLDNLDNKGSLVKDVYGGTCMSQLRCCSCGHCSCTPEPMNGLSLEIADADTLTDALESYTKAEKIEDIMLTCHGCESRVLMEKQTKIDQAPPVVFLHLKRFRNEGLSINKVDKFVEYPLELDLRPFISCPKDEEQTVYELYAVLVHRGNTASRGHYYSFIRSSPTTWHLMNDSRVEGVPETRALEQSAYILFYIKKGSSPWFSSLMDATQNIEDASPTPVPHSISSGATTEKEEQAGPRPYVSPECATDCPWSQINAGLEGEEKEVMTTPLGPVKRHCESLARSLKDKASSQRSGFLAGPPHNKKRRTILLDSYPSDVWSVVVTD